MILHNDCVRARTKVYARRKKVGDRLGILKGLQQETLV
jgi:hypothetical protein